MGTFNSVEVLNARACYRLDRPTTWATNPVAWIACVCAFAGFVRACFLLINVRLSKGQSGNSLEAISVVFEADISHPPKNSSFSVADKLIVKYEVI